ncbi:FG-GAP and VCBS repeat-containing protein, partial [Streptomyces atratus]
GKDDLVVTWSHVFADGMPTPRATVVYRGAANGVLKRGPRLKDARGKDMYGSTTLTSDVNKDGFADVIISLTCEIIGDEATPEGGSRLMVAYGGKTGQSTGLKPTTIDEKTPGLPGEPVSSHCNFGYAPATGDVNGDGYADVAFSAPTVSCQGRQHAPRPLHRPVGPPPRSLSVPRAASGPKGQAPGWIGPMTVPAVTSNRPSATEVPGISPSGALRVNDASSAGVAWPLLGTWMSKWTGRPGPKMTTAV